MTDDLIPPFNASRDQSKSLKQEIQERLELVVLGIILSRMSIIKEIDPKDFVSPKVAPIIEHMSRFSLDSTDSKSYGHASNELAKIIGVEWVDGEQKMSTIVNAIKENSKLRKLSSALWVLENQSRRPNSYGAVTKNLKRILKELDDESICDDNATEGEISEKDS